MAKNSGKTSLIVYLKCFNKGLLFFTIANFIWIIFYKLLLIEIQTNLNFLPKIGEIYYSIALSIVAGYIIFVITTEIPSVKRKLNFRHHLLKLINDLNIERLKLCDKFGIFEDDLDQLIKLDQVTHEYIETKMYLFTMGKLKLKEDEENKPIVFDHLKHNINETLIEIRKIISENSLCSLSFPDIFDEISKNLIDFEFIRPTSRKDYQYFISESKAIASEFFKLYVLLNSSVKNNSNYLIRIGYDRETVSVITL